MKIRLKTLYTLVNESYPCIKLFHRESEAVEWLRCLLFIVTRQDHKSVLNHSPLTSLLLTRRTVFTTPVHGLNSAEVECIILWVNVIIILNVINVFIIFKIMYFS